MEPTGQTINTQPAPQEAPDPNVASLVPQGQMPQPMHPDQAFAALGFATHISNKALMAEHGAQPGQINQEDQSSEEAPTEPQNAPGEEENPKEDNKESEMETRLMKQISDLKDQITNNHQSDELNRMKQEIMDLLKDDGQESKN